MLKNYLNVALRNLWKNKTFSLINIIGLALGLACSLLIMLWVLDERQVDGFHINKSSLYSLYERQYYDGRIEAGYYTPGLLGRELKKDLPEIKYATDYAWTDRLTFQVGDKILKEEGSYASEDFFRMFSFPLLEGKVVTALNSPTSLAISRKMAAHFFGNPAQAIGKTIRCENKKDFTIAAVFEDIPEKSSLKFDFLLNWTYFLQGNEWAKEWGNNGPSTAILLRPDADPQLVRSKIKKFLDHLNKEQGPGFRIELDMQRFDQKYLHAEFKNGQISGGRIEYVRLFSIIAVFIVLIACINFMNLTTARSVKRAREIGVRKVVGALRGGLIRQFMGEALLTVFIAVFFSLLLAVLLLPVFNSLTDKQISLPFSQPAFWVELFGLTILTGLISGSYPALFLSSFNPITVLKGSLRFGTKATLFRKGLVIFQFTLSILLIIGTIVVSKQVDYIQRKNLGYDRENLIYIPLEGDLISKYNLLKQSALKMPAIQGVSRITQSLTEIGSNTYGVDWEGKDPNTKPSFNQASVGYDFIKTAKVKLLQGRDISRDFPTDSVGYLINESALRRIGYKDPIGKRLTFWQKKGTIIGVMKDFHFNSLHLPIEPLILRFGEQEPWGNVLVRTQPGKTKEGLTSLEAICKQINPKFPFTYQFSNEEFRRLYKSEQLISKLSDYFAALAVFISCLGLLGLAIFTAEQRIKEIGIRKVLGASIGSLFGLLSKEFLVLVFLSLLIATPLAWLIMNHWLLNYAYHTDIGWWIFALAGIFALLIALLTISFQAAKAAMANPVKSLRTE